MFKIFGYFWGQDLEFKDSWSSLHNMSHEECFILKIKNNIKQAIQFRYLSRYSIAIINKVNLFNK